MGFDVDFAEPYLEETAYQPGPSLIPQFLDVQIAGHNYIVDTSFEPYRRDAFRHRSIQSQRESISLDNIPGVGTVNTEGLWRREAWDFHKGAGQPYQDRKDSDDARFSTSKGINPWMQWQVELLDDTKLVKPLDSLGQVMQCGAYVYVIDNTAENVSFSSDLSNWTVLTGLSGAPLMMATDGYNLWISTTANLYATTTGAASATLYVTGEFGSVWYVGDRLMATSGDSVYNIITSGSAPSPLWTHPNVNFNFTSMAAGSSQIYIGGYVDSGNVPPQSHVYRTTIEATGTALTIPVQALPLEAGEYCTSLYGYLNYVFVGTNLGLRMCRTIAAYDPTGNEGDLEAGPLIPGLFPPGPVNSPVYCITGNNRFVYFGWNNYDSVSTGLGRCDLSTFVDTQAPAFASDLMVTGQGPVFSMDWCTISGSPIFVVAGLGVYTSTGNPVSSGYIRSGYIGYGISDDKIVMAGGIGTLQPQSGTVSMAVASDANSNVFAFVGQRSPSTSPSSNVFAINPTRGTNFQVQMTLTSQGGVSPVLNRWTLKALPGVASGTTISVVLAIWEEMNVKGQDYFFDPYAEYAYLEGLRRTQTLFEYIEGPYSAVCTIDELDWLPEKARDANTEGGYQGNLIVYLKTWIPEG